MCFVRCSGFRNIDGVVKIAVHRLDLADTVFERAEDIGGGEDGDLHAIVVEGDKIVGITRGKPESEIVQLGVEAERIGIVVVRPVFPHGDILAGATRATVLIGRRDISRASGEMIRAAVEGKTIRGDVCAALDSLRPNRGVVEILGVNRAGVSAGLGVRRADVNTDRGGVQPLKQGQRDD